MEYTHRNQQTDKNLYYSVKTAAGIHTITQERPNINDISGYTKKKSTRIIKGLDTTAKVRDIMINEILFGIVNQRPELINNTSIMDEIKTLQRKRTGKIEHADGKHDDQLFSYLIGLYPLLFDNNIILSGTWNISVLFSIWFGIDNTGNTDVTEPINNLLEIAHTIQCGNVMFTTGKYKITSIILCCFIIGTYVSLSWKAFCCKNP